MFTALFLTNLLLPEWITCIFGNYATNTKSTCFILLKRFNNKQGFCYKINKCCHQRAFQWKVTSVMFMGAISVSRVPPSVTEVNSFSQRSTHWNDSPQWREMALPSNCLDCDTLRHIYRWFVLGHLVAARFNIWLAYIFIMAFSSLQNVQVVYEHES
jgi:hypothetical protein